MEETEFVNSESQVAPAEIATHETTNQEATQQQQPVVEDKQERNWKAAREKQRELERELRLQKEMNEKLMQLATQNAPKQQEIPDELDSLADDEFISKGKVKQLITRQAAKIAQEETQKMLQQQHQSQFMVRLKSQYPDFDDVVNADTLALLEEQKPELANTIAELKDPYKIGVSSYEYIKALNLGSQSPTARRAKEVEKKLADNAKTVQSPQAYDKRPMAQAYKITEAENKKIYEEMTMYARQAGSGY